ncbi:sensor histidine kinase [Algoriphagus hitonicola]|uniref:histidine kinase n=1 Tax=Algoriphagus hitonicola TaxID=435880 RepID=A0A1I2T9M3_9BACT|nr:ATP-binding protein [Algoriphagus hitonicola]SFG61595.1 PAS domain S-box-containing protein [Algoriphagus hitonicola]
MKNQLITYTDNEDLIFSLSSGELLKISSRLKTLFGAKFWEKILDLNSYEGIACLSPDLDSRLVAYPKYMDLKVSYELTDTDKRLKVVEYGWYNPKADTIHLLIFPVAVESNFNLTHDLIVDLLDKLVDPAVLFNREMSNVIVTNYNLISCLNNRLSELGKGFQVSDFFLEKLDYQSLLFWVYSNEISIQLRSKLDLKKKGGCWFDVSFSKIKIEEDYCILAILKDVDEQVSLSQIQEKRNLIFSRLSEVQISFLSKSKYFNPYQHFLDAILDVSKAKYGFVGEVSQSEGSARLMKIHAVTDFSFEGKDAVDLLEKLKNDQFIFRHFDNLFGASIRLGKVICENNPKRSPYSKNVHVPGHPIIENFLGIPILKRKEVVGLIGLGNKEGGFSQSDVDDLSPFATTYSVILDAIKTEVRSEEFRRESSEKSLILSTLGEHSPDTIAVLDSANRFQLLTPAYKKLLGPGLGDELIQSKIRHLILKTHTPKYHQFKGNYRSRLKVKLYDQEEMWLETSINVVEREQGEITIAFIRDVTRQMQQEISLKSSLEKEIEFKNFLSDFLSLVSHDFKTPLATLNSSLDIGMHYLNQIGNTVIKEKLERHFNKMSSEINILQNLVSHSLDYNRFATKDSILSKSKISFVDFFNNLINGKDFTDSVSFKNFCLEDFTVYWDAFLMERAVLNLIANGIKYNPENGKVEIEIFGTPETHGFSVSDAGIGIPNEEITYIFTPFFRASNSSEFQGSGLGLGIVKNVIEGHEGEIFVESKIGEGTRVSVHFNKR